MKLKEYLAQFAVKQKDFAEQIGDKPENINRYCLGRRMPKPPVMRKIFEATGGLVDANSFYLLPNTEPAAEKSVSGSDPVAEDENAALSSDFCRSSDVHSDEGGGEKS